MGLKRRYPPDANQTVEALAYCAQKNHQKVIWIDPITIEKYGKVPIIEAINNKQIKASVDGTLKALSYLFGTKLTDTRRVLRFAGAMLRILAKTGNTLYETKYFSLYGKYKPYRDAIYDGYYGDQHDLETLNEVFRSSQVWENLFGSSVNQLNLIWDEPLNLILGGKGGINFQSAISNGWVIIANLSPYRMTEEESKLLGLILISQLFQAVRSLVNNKWKGVYYLYIDEAGRFTSPQIKELLTYMRQSGVRLVLAHHDFEQFREAPEIMAAILNGARIKFMMDTPSYDDRLKMIKQLGYGGDIPPILAAYGNQNIPKQEAVVRKHKEPPVRIRIPDVPSIEPASEEYIQQVLSQPFYKNTQEIKDEINARIAPENTSSPGPGKTFNRKANNVRSAPKQSREVPDDSQGPPIAKRPKPIKF